MMVSFSPACIVTELPSNLGSSFIEVVLFMYCPTRSLIVVIFLAMDVVHPIARASIV